MEPGDPERGAGIDGREELLLQITQLGESVGEMRAAFEEALRQLGGMGPPPGGGVASDIQARLDSLDEKTASQVTELLRMILQVKTELSGLRGQVSMLLEGQETLASGMHSLVADREMIVDELSSNGAISHHLRDRLSSNGRGLLRVERPGSGSNSNDSGVHINDHHHHHHHHHPLPLLYHDELLSEGGGSPIAEGEDSDGGSVTVAAQRSLRLADSLSQQCLQRALDAQLHMRDDGNVDEEEEEEMEGREEEEERRGICKEILEGERKYCGSLRRLLEEFGKPLSEEGILSRQDSTSLIPEELGVLYGKHCKVLEEMESELDEGRQRGLLVLFGPIFASFLGIPADKGQGQGPCALALYTTYVNNFPDVISCFQRLCRSSPAFVNFLKREEGKRELGGLLLAPVQRLPQYVLGMRKLVKSTRETHPDYEPLSSSLSGLRGFLNRLNDAMQHACHLLTSGPAQSSHPASGNRERELGKGNGLRASVSSNTSSEASLPSRGRSKVILTSHFARRTQRASNNNNNNNNKGSSFAPRSRSVPRHASASTAVGEGSSSARRTPSPSRSRSSTASGSLKARIRRARNKSDQDGEGTSLSMISTRFGPIDPFYDPKLHAHSLVSYCLGSSRTRSYHDIKAGSRANGIESDLAASDPSLYEPGSSPHRGRRRNAGTQSEERGERDLERELQGTFHSLIGVPSVWNGDGDVPRKKDKKDKKDRHHLSIKDSLKSIFAIKKRGSSKVFQISSATRDTRDHRDTRDTRGFSLDDPEDRLGNSGVVMTQYGADNVSALHPLDLVHGLGGSPSDSYRDP